MDWPNVRLFSSKSRMISGRRWRFELRGASRPFQPLGPALQRVITACYGWQNGLGLYGGLPSKRQPATLVRGKTEDCPIMPRLRTKKEKDYDLSCPKCGKNFKPFMSNQRFCSTHCKMEYHRIYASIFRRESPEVRAAMKEENKESYERFKKLQERRLAKNTWTKEEREQVRARLQDDAASKKE